jgi:hypothetical protein
VGAFSLGLSAIPGLTAAQRDALSTLAPAAASTPAGVDASADPAAMLGPRPVLDDAPKPRNLIGRFLSWIGGLW